MNSNFEIQAPDWELLRKQKLGLLDMTHELVNDKPILDGLIHLIDSIQDSAVKSGIWTEGEVFGKITTLNRFSIIGRHHLDKSNEDFTIYRDRLVNSSFALDDSYVDQNDSFQHPYTDEIIVFDDFKNQF